MNVTLVNTSAPELNRLAVALHEHGELAYFVRPFANRPRKWVQPLLKVGALSRLYDSSLGRRGIENTELLHRVIEGGVIADLTMAVVRRSKLNANLKTKLEFQLYELMRAGIQKAAVNALSDATHVLANVGTALVPFLASSRSSVKKVLHYPSAHPRYFERVWREEAKLQPEFSKTWPDFGQLTEEILRNYDEEIAHADVIVVGSRFVEKTFLLQGVPQEKLRIIPYGVDLQTFSLRDTTTTPEEFRALFVGRIEQRKGLSYLLEGFKKFARPGARLRLVGNVIGSDQPLREYAGLYEHIPHLTHRELSDEMRASSVLVLPSLLEGLPLSVMEAMATGVPVITTPCGADDLIRDGIEGKVVPMRSSEAIAVALEELFNDRAKLIKMGDNAARRIQEFSWQSFSNRYRAGLKAW